MYIGYRLRVTGGEMTGQWLTRIDVTKGGTPFRDAPNYEYVALHPDQFQIYPKFSPDEAAAWSGINRQNALTYQSIVASTGVRTEIVEPTPQ